MSYFPVHIAATHHESLPPVAELPTVEADSPEEALALLRREAFIAPPGAETVWLKVVVSTWPNGNARQVLSTEIQVQRVDELN